MNHYLPRPHEVVFRIWGVWTINATLRFWSGWGLNVQVLGWVVWTCVTVLRIADIWNGIESWRCFFLSFFLSWKIKLFWKMSFCVSTEQDSSGYFQLVWESLLFLSFMKFILQFISILYCKKKWKEKGNTIQKLIILLYSKSNYNIEFRISLNSTRTSHPSQMPYPWQCDLEVPS